MKLLLIYTCISFIVLSGFGLAIYFKKENKEGCGCSGKSCGTDPSCKLNKSVP